jgi:hypothetical protein
LWRIASLARRCRIVCSSLCGASAIPGANSGFECGEQVGERPLWVCGGWHGAGSFDLLLFQRGLPGLVQEVIHVGLHLGHIGLALAEPVVQRAEGGVGKQFGHAGHG